MVVNDVDCAVIEACQAGFLEIDADEVKVDIFGVLLCYSNSSIPYHSAVTRHANHV